jgi:hypothetical protein
MCWNLERLGHLYVPITLSIKSHGGDLLDLTMELAGLLGGGKPRKYEMLRVEGTY